MCSYKHTKIIFTALIIAININIISFVATWRATKVSLSLFSFILLWWMLIWCLKLDNLHVMMRRSRAWYSGRNVDTCFHWAFGSAAIGIFVLCIYFWLYWALVAPMGFPLAVESRVALSNCEASAPHGGFSCRGPGAPGTWASSPRGSLGSRAQVQKLWLTGLAPLQCTGSSQPRIEPASSTLPGVFFTTEPAEVPNISVLL